MKTEIERAAHCGCCGRSGQKERCGLGGEEKKCGFEKGNDGVTSERG